MMTKIQYILFYTLFRMLAALPFALLYALSDMIFVLVYYIVRYRRKLVWRNLTTSFPGQDEATLRQTERQFYHWLCDYIFETIKLLNISNEKLLRHIEFRGVEQMEQCFDKGQDCAAILGHYCNWEWLSATGLAYQRHPDTVTGLIYHPLYNDAFDQLFIDIRKAHGGVCIPKQEILRHLVTYKRENRRSLFGYISDQAPRWHNIHLWLPFLNHDTPVFTGGERIMRKMDDAVFYVEMERPKRGQYICTFKLVSPHASQEPENEITRRFFQMLEATITREPSYYLWTHNRWKRTHEEFDRQYIMVKGKAILREEFKES